MNVIETLTIVLLISTSMLCIALIYFLYKINKSVHSISLNIQGVSIKLIPLVESTLDLSKRITHITNGIESQLQISKSIIIDIRDRVDKYLNAEAIIRTGIVDAAMPIVKNINAIGIGLNSFWRKFKNK